MKAYVAFCAFAAHDFEAFLIPFQSNEPMIHLLHPALCNLLHGLQSKFIKSFKLKDDLSENIYIDVNNSNNVKNIKSIEIGTKALSLFGNNLIMSSEKEIKFGKNCLSFFVTTCMYLQKNLPLEVGILYLTLH